jgi:hypothetical protein
MEGHFEPAHLSAAGPADSLDRAEVPLLDITGYFTNINSRG